MHSSNNENYKKNIRNENILEDYLKTLRYRKDKTRGVIQ